MPKIPIIPARMHLNLLFNMNHAPRFAAFYRSLPALGKQPSIVNNSRASSGTILARMYAIRQAGWTLGMQLPLNSAVVGSASVATATAMSSRSVTICALHRSDAEPPPLYRLTLPLSASLLKRFRSESQRGRPLKKPLLSRPRRQARRGGWSNRFPNQCAIRPRRVER